MSTSFDAVTDSQDPPHPGADAARHHLEVILRAHTTGRKVPADMFVEDSVFPLASPEMAQMVVGAAHELVGATAYQGPAIDGRGDEVSARLSGDAEVEVTLRVEPHHPHRVVEIGLVPPVTTSPSGVTTPYPLPPGLTTTALSSVGDEIDGRLAAWLAAVRERLQLVGVDAALYIGPEIVWAGSSGVADQAGRSPAPLSDVVRVGSISKTMTTIRALQLVASGDLDLDTVVADKLTSWRLQSLPGAPDLRLRHLMTHTGGLREVPETRYFPPESEPIPHLTDWLDDPVVMEEPPGSGWSYSNVGMTLLGQVIADVTGSPIELDIAEHVFSPLGMTDTSFFRPDLPGSSFLDPFVEGVEGVAPIPSVHVGPRAAGSVFSTLADIGRWAGEVVAGAAGGGALLPAHLWRQVFADHAAVSGTDMQMGLGFLRAEVDGVDLAWHNGAMPGAAAQLWIAPTAGLSLAVFTNVYSPHRPMSLERSCAHELAALVRLMQT